MPASCFTMGNSCSGDSKVRVAFDEERIYVSYANNTIFLRKNSLERIYYYHISGEVFFGTTAGHEDQRHFMPPKAQAQLSALVEKHSQDFFE